MPNAPAASCALCSGSMHTSIHSGGTGNIRHSPRNGFTAYIALSPGTGLFCPRHFRGIVSHETLAPASGRQDHTTSPSATSAARLASPPRPSHPAPNVRDDRDTPLLRVRDAGKNTHFLIFRKRNIFAWRADNPNQLESAREIRFYAHAIFRSERRSREATSSKIRLSRPVGQITWYL